METSQTGLLQSGELTLVHILSRSVAGPAVIAFVFFAVQILLLTNGVNHGLAQVDSTIRRSCASLEVSAEVLANVPLDVARASYGLNIKAINALIQATVTSIHGAIGILQTVIRLLLSFVIGTWKCLAQAVLTTIGGLLQVVLDNALVTAQAVVDGFFDAVQWMYNFQEQTRGFVRDLLGVTWQQPPKFSLPSSLNLGKQWGLPIEQTAVGAVQGWIDDADDFMSGYFEQSLTAVAAILDSKELSNATYLSAMPPPVNITFCEEKVSWAAVDEAVRRVQSIFSIFVAAVVAVGLLSVVGGQVATQWFVYSRWRKRQAWVVGRVMQMLRAHTQGGISGADGESPPNATFLGGGAGPPWTEADGARFAREVTAATDLNQRLPRAVADFAARRGKYVAFWVKYVWHPPMLAFCAFAVLGVLLTSAQLLLLQHVKVRFSAEVSPTIRSIGSEMGAAVATALGEFEADSLRRINGAITAAVDGVNRDVLGPISVVADAIHNKFEDAQQEVLGKVSSWVSGNADFVFFGQTFIPDLINGLYVCLIGSKLQMFDKALQTIAGWEVEALLIDPGDLAADAALAKLDGLAGRATSYLLGRPVVSVHRDGSNSTAYTGGAVEALLQASVEAVQLARLANLLLLAVVLLFMLQGALFAVYQHGVDRRRRRGIRERKESSTAGESGKKADFRWRHLRLPGLRSRWEQLSLGDRRSPSRSHLMDEEPPGSTSARPAAAPRTQAAQPNSRRSMLSLHDLSAQAVKGSATLSSSEVLRRPGVIDLRAAMRHVREPAAEEAALAAEPLPAYTAALDQGSTPSKDRPAKRERGPPRAPESRTPPPIAEVTQSGSEVVRGALRIGDPRLAAIARGYRENSNS